MHKILKISLAGVLIETIGLILDIFHHLEIGIKTPEGLITWQHTIIFIGFVVTASSVIKLFINTKT